MTSSPANLFAVEAGAMPNFGLTAFSRKFAEKVVVNTVIE